MKKFYCFTLMLLTLFACVFFSACGDKYKNLTMTFISQDGENISEINLLLDQTDEIEIGVKISGLDSKEIGKVQIYCPAGIASIPNDDIQFSNSIFYFKVVATKPGVGDIVFKHLSSNKLKTLPLRVDLKSSNLTTTNCNYVVSIPNENSKTINFNPENSLSNDIVQYQRDLIRFVPQESTDLVYYTYDTSSALERKILEGKIEISTTRIQDVKDNEIEVIDAITVFSNLDEKLQIVLHPVAVMDGFENKLYSNQSVNLVVTKTLTNSSFCLQSDDYHQNHLDNNETIILIANNHSVANKDNAKLYQYDYLPLELATIYEGEIISFNDPTSTFNYPELYDLEVELNNPNITYEIDNQNNRVLIYASANISTPDVSVSLNLNPKNCVGDIFQVYKTITVRAELQPEIIDVTMQGESLVTNDEGHVYNLFDYYADNEGALFKFTPKVKRQLMPYSDMMSMQILVDPSILNKLDDTPVEDGLNYATNLYLLDFYLNYKNQPVEFTYDSSIQKFVSQPITQLDNVYVRYEVNEKASSVEISNLTFSVKTIYTGELEYLSGIKFDNETKMYFNNEQGVQDVTLVAGQIVLDGGFKINTYGEPLGETTSKDMFLDRLAYGNLNDNSGAYVLYLSEVKGKNNLNSDVLSTSFKVEVSRKGANALKIKQYDSDDRLALGLEGSEVVQNFIYSPGYMSNSVVLIFDAATDLGDYQIVLSHENGYKKVVDCFVFETLTKNNLESALNYSFSGINDYAYENKVGEDYLFDGYLSDFIVAVNKDSSRKINFSIDLEEKYLISNIVNGYSYSAKMDSLPIGKEYVTLNKYSNNLSIIFNKGSFNADTKSNKYIQLEFSVQVAKFENIFFKVEGEDTPISISRTFFVFEPIERKDISIGGVPSEDRYPFEMLGYYYKQLAKLNLTLNLNDNLKNYLTENKQISNYGNIVKWNFDTENVFQREVGLEDGDYKLSGNITAITEAKDIKITAYLQQFNRVITTDCIIHVLIPNITQTIEIVNLMDEQNITKFLQINEVRQTEYLDLEKGNQITVESNNISNGKIATFGNEIVLIALDNVGNRIREEDIFISNKTFKINNVNGNNIKIVGIARDAIETKLDGANFMSIKDLLLDGHENAYFEIELMLSDGSKANPYIINDATDFWGVKTGDESAGVYYTLMTNINLNTANLKHSPIADFRGQINSYAYKENDDGEEIVVEYSLFGITLNNNFLHLFENFSGALLNINFDVDFAYNKTNAQNLGLIDISSGRLENVTLTIDGSANIDVNNINFGVLVGTNSGTIKYTSNSLVGVSGNITLSGSGEFVFGGLVGQNNGEILGYESGAEKINLNLDYAKIDNLKSDIVFSVMLGDSGAMVSLNVDAKNLTNKSSAVGGVVGLNTNEIKDAYATGTINANCIVGGIIGKNQTTKLRLSIDNIPTEISPNNSGYFAQNLKSSMIISGADYVGGIVGQDDGGSYYNCHTQILVGNAVAISGANYVGGIAGYSRYGTFSFCSVMSYRWDYSDLETTFTLAEVVDIYGTNNVGGMVGFVESNLKTLDGGEYNTNNGISLTTVMYSSVNALLGVAQNGTIHGIFNSNENESERSIIFNAYFMGKIVSVNGTQLTDLDVKNNDELTLADNSTIFNNVYSINVFNNELQIGVYPNDADNSFSCTTPANEHWAQNDSLNGGYIFITLEEDGTNPIFEQSPTNLNAEVAKPLVDGENRLTYLLHLYYYDFVLDGANTNNSTILNTLNNQFNRYKILANGDENGIINIGIEPNISGEVRIVAESSNPSIISISGNYILVNNLGECSLTFSSALNPKISCTLSVIVSAPIGDEFVLSASAADAEKSITGTTQQIALNKSKQYYSIAKATKTYKINGVGQTDFNYKTSNQVYLDVQIKPTAELEEGTTIGNYLSISGITPSADNSVTLNPATPFSVQVLKHFENGEFTITIKPYIVIKYLEKAENETGQPKTLKLFYEKEINFNIKTYQGPSQIKVNYEHVVLYPNDSTDIFVHITTDYELQNDELQIIDSIKIINSNGEIIKSSNATDPNKRLEIQNYIKLQNSSSFENNIQIVKYTVTFNEELHITEEETMIIRFAIKNTAIESEISFNLHPQRIDNIEIKNYVYVYKNGIIETENDVAKIEPSKILRPIGYGLIIINLSPNNGYYNYLEITDTTGNEEIVFMQIDGINGKRYGNETQANFGKGIRLNKYNDTNTLYVATRIDSRFSSKLHTIRVAAYDMYDNLIISTDYEIDVKMLPQIEMDYVDPNGIHFDNSSTQYLALGVPANLEVRTRNSNGDVQFEGEIADSNLNFDDCFEVVGENGHYSLLSVQNKNLIGKTLTLKATTTLTLDDGKVEDAYYDMNFIILPYVIHNVSVNSSRVTFGQTPSETTRVLYGDFGVPTVLNFYFNYFDISYLDNGSYWDTQYSLDPTYNSESTVSSERDSIQSILYNINSEKCLQLGKINNGKFEQLTDNNVATLLYLDEEGNKKIQLLVNSNEDNNLVLKLEFNLTLNENNLWEIATETEDQNTLHFEYIYVLNFANSTSFLEPEVIKNEQEFLDLNNINLPEKNYILGNDLVLENYSPIDANIASFDGNGRKIIIKSFSQFNDAEINIGLFRQVYQGMLVSNLEVVYFMDNAEDNYPLGYIDANNLSNSNYIELCTNSSNNYTSALFGGLTPTNNGVITNCKVSGGVALRTSALENQTDRSINFNMGGLVGINNGYLTNCQSRIALAACANIGGLVYENSGKIASCSFNAENQFSLNDQTIYYSQENSAISELRINSTGLIYAFNRQSSASAQIHVFVGGFAVYNRTNTADFKEISMSFVLSGSRGTESNITAGNGTAGGFVYRNEGKIYNCYTQISSFGQSGGRFSGFVDTNSGEITMCYSFVNNGRVSSLTSSQFAPKNTTGITNSYEILDLAAGTQLNGYLNDKKVDGVDIILLENRFNKNSYSSFMFGDERNGVWKLYSGQLPILTSTETQVNFNLVYPSTESMFYGLRNIQREETKTEIDNQIITSYKYVISDNGYGTKTNPILIYDIDTWNYYLAKDNTIKFYRLVCDLNFSNIYNNPKTSVYNFSGNLQGNNMLIDNVMIYSSNNLQSIGLFKSLSAQADNSIDYVISNLKISCTRFSASKTNSVGILAGIIEGYKIYNVELSSKNNIIVGGNAVGGLAGIIRGNFDIDGITSEVSVNSESKSSSTYSIYMSVNNKKAVSFNLQDTHYAGSIAGIVDGYYNSSYDINAGRNINNNYMQIKNVSVNNSVSVIGDTVGILFGFMGERVKLTKANVNVNGCNLIGNQYSAGLVGENRGIIRNSQITVSADANIFSSASYTCAGLVGLNLGGLIQNCSANVDIIKAQNDTIVGGLIGRNVNGYILNSNYSGKLLGHIAGGIIGSAYDKEVFTNAISGSGAINYNCHEAIPENKLVYTDGTNNLDNLKDVRISLSTLNYWLENINLFYTYNINKADLLSAIESERAFGLAVGAMQYVENPSAENSGVNFKISQYGYNETGAYISFNGADNINKVGLVANATLQDDFIMDTPFSNIIDTISVSKTFVMYTVGLKLNDFDNWSSNGYSGDMLILTNENVNELELWRVNDSFEEQEQLTYYLYFENSVYNIVNNNSGTFALKLDYSYLTKNGDIDSIKTSGKYSDNNQAKTILFMLTTDTTKITFTFENQSSIEYSFKLGKN